ncbi:ABC transporter permease [Bacillus sp. JJ1764]|uniref:ABC transporter permease n=1 Tax=Bacillus sp. JJ1764 TaxID=3122964 RepID=UPI0030000538
MWQITKMIQKVNKSKRLLGVIPAFLFILFFFIGGTVQAILMSIGMLRGALILPQGERFAVYKELINERFFHSVGVTVGMAAVVAILSGVLGLLAAIYLAEKSYKWKWTQLIFHLPIGIPHLLAAYMFMQVFMQSGWISRLLFHLGLIDSMERFPMLIHDEWGVGVILAYLWKEIPFMILLIYPFIVKLISEWRDQAGLLGATFPQQVRWIFIPLLVPLWVGGMWVVFAFVLAGYEIPALLARTAFGSIPVIAWQEYTEFGLDRQPIAIAMNVILAVISLIVGFLLIYFQMKWYKQGRRLW